jgi:hypothetical protein
MPVDYTMADQSSSGSASTTAGRIQTQLWVDGRTTTWTADGAATGSAHGRGAGRADDQLGGPRSVSAGTAIDAGAPVGAGGDGESGALPVSATLVVHRLRRSGDGSVGRCWCPADGRRWHEQPAIEVVPEDGRGASTRAWARSRPMPTAP